MVEQMNQVSISSWLRHWRSLCFTGTASSVECGGCRACCKDWDVVVEGNELRMGGYDTVESNGRKVLKRQENGDCIYLTPAGCNIYYRRPRICRQFDCRTYCVAGRVPHNAVGEAATRQWASLTYRTDDDYISMIAVRLAADKADLEGVEGEGKVTGYALNGYLKYLEDAFDFWQRIKELRREDPAEYAQLMEQFNRGN